MGKTTLRLHETGRPGSVATGTQTTPLMGREPEVGRIRELIMAGRRKPQSLLVLGRGGTGKTKLLGAAVGQARVQEIRVLTAEGCEPESQQSFAALHQLLLPVLGDADRDLPEHLREAVRIAFGLAAAAHPPEPMALRAAVSMMLGQLTQVRPVLLVLDDIQYCDRDSLDVLFFVARRLANEAVTVLLAAQGEVPPPGVPADLAALTLGPLSEQAAAQLLDSQPWSPSGRARLDVLRQAEGNPLAIIELCRAMRDGGQEAPPEGVAPRSSRIEHLFAAGLDQLPEATERALTYAAVASEQEDLAVIMKALGDADLGVWVPAENAGLVSVAGGRVRFRHSLVRAAVFHRASAQQRQQAHRDLAALLTADPSRRAWHLAGASTGPDESVAIALEDSAGQAQLRGGMFAAARALEEAARLSPHGADRARRLAKAVTAASGFGDPSWVRELYARFTTVNEDPALLGPAACGASWALSLFAFQREAFDLLSEVLAHHPPRDRRTAHAMASIFAGIAHQSGLPEHQDALSGLLQQVARIERAEDPEERPRSAHFGQLARSEAVEPLSAVALAVADPGAAPRLLRRFLKAGPESALDASDAATRSIGIGSLAYLADESDRCVDVFRRVMASLHARGIVLSGDTVLLAPHVNALLDTGRWAEADTLIEEGSAVAAVRKLTHVEMDLEALRVTLRALRGHSEHGIVLTGPHWHAVSLDENRATQALMLRARGLDAMAAEDFENAYRHLRALFEGDGRPLHCFLSARSIAELASAADRIGRTGDAATVLAAVRAQQGTRPTTRMRLLLHHAAALVGKGEDTENHFRLAVVNPAADQWPLERVHARLNFAIWLRRQRRPREARSQLAAVLEAATRLGAGLLVEQASGELRASGVAPSAHRADLLSDLTAQQQQIVRLAAKGLTNREIAEKLHLSPRTVGSHLYNVYPKLGISKRHQLRDVLEES